MKRAMALLVCAALCLAFAPVLAEEDLEMVYFAVGGFRFWYPAQLQAQMVTEVDADAGLMMYAAGAQGELCVMRYETGDVSLEALAASLLQDETCENVLLDDARSVTMLTYDSAEGTMNTVIAGNDGCLYEILLGGDEMFAGTAAQIVRSTLVPA